LFFCVHDAAAHGQYLASSKAWWIYEGWSAPQSPIPRNSSTVNCIKLMSTMDKTIGVYFTLWDRKQTTLSS